MEANGVKEEEAQRPGPWNETAAASTDAEQREEDPACGAKELCFLAQVLC